MLLAAPFPHLCDVAAPSVRFEKFKLLHVGKAQKDREVFVRWLPEQPTSLLVLETGPNGHVIPLTVEVSTGIQRTNGRTSAAFIPCNQKTGLKRQARPEPGTVHNMIGCNSLYMPRAWYWSRMGVKMDVHLSLWV